MANQSKIEVVLSAITNGFEGRLRAAMSSVKALGTSAAQADKGGLSRARQGVESISTALGQLKQAAAGAFALNAVQGYAAQFITAADAMRNMDQRLLLTAKNTNDYAAAQKTVVDIARDSHQGLAEVANLYTRMALATANLNIGQQELAEVTKTVALATALSGSSASEASAGLQQFAQAMASNRLGGDELRSVLENMPLLTKVFVDAAGGSMAKLREMAEKGQLTTEWMIAAIKAAKETIEAQAAAMPATVGRSMTDLKNQASLYVASVDQATNFTTKLAGVIDYLGAHLDMVAKGGMLALGTGISALIGGGLAAATLAVTDFMGKISIGTVAVAANTVSVSANAQALTGYGMAASIAATQTAANTAAQTAATAAQVAAGSTAARLLPALLGLVNPITAITTVLGIGATAWALWGQTADSELDKAKRRVAELERTNKMLKSAANPDLEVDEQGGKVAAARAEVARREKELRNSYSESVSGDLAAEIKGAEAMLNFSRNVLAEEEKAYALTQDKQKITVEQRGGLAVAAEMSVTDAIKKQDEERRKITASKLENDLAEIAKKRDAELAAIGKQHSAEGQALIKAAINSRFDTAASQAKKEAAEKAGKASDAAAKKAETAANKAERAAKKEEAAAISSGHIAAKVAAEKLRISTEGNLLALEQERIEAQRLPTLLARAEAEMDIARRVMAEKIALATAEAKVVETDPKASEADKIKAKREILKLEIDATRDDYANMAAVAQENLSTTEQAWRRGTGSVEEYRAAVIAAGREGVLTADEIQEKMVASGNDMGAALSLGFQRARERMQTDAEMMIYIGENIGEQIAGGLTNAWDSFITGTATAKEALIDFARSTISWLSQIILKQMLMTALQGASGMFSPMATGSSTAGAYIMANGMAAFADGGAVGGWSPSPTADNIPAWLTAREFVQPVRAVDHYGIAFMESIRRLRFPRSLAHALAGGTIPRIPSGYRLAQGGQVPGQAPTTNVKTGDTRLRVINVLDKNMVGDYLRTSDGETAIINMIRRNGTTIRTLIGG